MEIKMGQDDRYETKDGNPVRILCVDALSNARTPVIYLMRSGEADFVGRCALNGTDGFCPTQFIREKKTKYCHEKWVVLFRSASGEAIARNIYNSERSAEDCGKSSFGRDFIKVQKIIIEGEY